MDIRFALRALEVPSDEPSWQSLMLGRLGQTERPGGDCKLTKDEQPSRHPRPLLPAICS
jgi:hypothetical protein